MRQLLSSAVIHQQMPADEMQQTRTLLEAIVSGHWTARLKFGAWEEIADLQAGGGAILQGETHQRGNHVVETDQFSGAVRAFHAQKDFCRPCIVMDAEVQLSLASDPDLLRNAIATSKEGSAGTLTVVYIVQAVCRGRKSLSDIGGPDIIRWLI
jgi:hypothetical protein